jgi:hypothetical protein
LKDKLFCVCGWGLGFELSQGFAKLAPYHLSHNSSPFCSGYFEDGVLPTICLGWPRTSSNLLILASK